MFVERFQRWLIAKSAPRVIVLLALVLASPALTTGLTADDYFQKLVLTGKSNLAPIPHDPLAMFTWARGDPEHAQAMMEVGMTGWWTDPELVMAYLRPLSVVTHYLDYRLWPESPFLMHAHSLLWFAVALLLLGKLYGRLLGNDSGAARAAPPRASQSRGAPPHALGSFAPLSSPSDDSPLSTTESPATDRARAASRRRESAGVAPEREGRFAPSERLAALPGLALLLYAIDDAHGMTIAWVANRNALVAFALALPVLLAYDRAVRDKDRRAAALGPLALLLALLAGESALAITGYLFAYALFLDPEPRPRALRRLLPYLAVSALWAVTYRALGYGARGSGLVVDPGNEPLRFLVKAAERVPVLLTAQFAFPPSDPWEAYSALAPWLPALMFGLALVTLGLFAAGLRHLLAREPVGRFFAFGSLCAALPVAAQFPHDRLLLFVGLGAMPVVAMLLGELFFGAGLSGLPRGLAVGCALLHLGLAPLWLPLRVRAPLDAERMIGTAERSIDDSPAIGKKTVVIVNPPVDAYAGYIAPMRAAQGRTRPRAVRWLATGGSELTLERVDAKTLHVRPKDGFLSMSSERMQRDPRAHMPAGHRVHFSDLEIEVTALTADGRPAEILARFAYPLEDARYVFLHFAGKRFEPFPLPAVGQRRTLPPVDFTELLP